MFRWSGAGSLSGVLNLIIRFLYTFMDPRQTWGAAPYAAARRNWPVDVQNVASYRPISNLPHLSKILQRIINCQLVSHLEEFRLLPEVQSAYRRGHYRESSPQSFLGPRRRHLELKVCTTVFFRFICSFRYGWPQHPTASSWNVIRLSWHAARMPALVPWRKEPVCRTK